MSCDYSQAQSVPSGYITPPSEWAPCLSNMLRVHIGDFTDPPQYSDERLFQVISSAAWLLDSELCSCEIDKPTVECDGTMDSNPLDFPGYSNLLVLKSACLLDRGQARQKFIADGIRAACGPAMVQVMTGSEVYKALFEYGACAAFNQLKMELCFLCPLKSATHASQIVGFFVSDYYASCGNFTGRCRR